MTDKQTNELNSGIHFFVKIVFSTFALIISGLNAFYLLIADAIPGEVQFSAAEQVWLWIFLAVPLGFIWISWARKQARIKYLFVSIVSIVIVYFSGLYLISQV